MKIYIAGASKELGIVKNYIKEVLFIGHTITHDWTKEIEEHGANPREVSLDSMRNWSDNDLAGVRNSNLVWLITPENNSAGCWVEFGFALGIHRRVIISGDWKKSIFSSLAYERFPTHDLALQFLRG